jgi:hypothetical protein
LSDDVPVILAHDSGAHRIAFASAAAESQVEQYLAAGWSALATPDFASVKPIDRARIALSPAGDLATVDVLSIEGPFTEPGLPRALSARPVTVKINFAFYDLPPTTGADAAARLAGAGYVLLAAHWRNDNTFGLRSLSCVEPLASLQPPEWPRLNLIASRDVRLAETVLRLGRVHAAQERRIADLRVGEAVRNDNIAKLEDALQALQERFSAK